MTDLLELNENLILMLFLSVSIIICLVNIILSNYKFHKILFFSIFSTLVCIFYLLLDAPDVAMTEAAIGVCVSTVIIFTFLTKYYNIPEVKRKFDSVRFIYSIIAVTAVIMLFIEFDKIIPAFADTNSPINTLDSKYYIENTLEEIKIPAYVAAILGSYRGFDTMGETIVVLIAGIGFLLITAQKESNDE